MIKICNLTKIYNEGKANSCIALSDVNLCIEKGESVAIVGPSGAGKTTLLNILRGQMMLTEGKILFDDFSFANQKYDTLNKFKRDNIANIYQDYSLIEELTVLDNIELPLCIKGIKKNERLLECTKVIKSVGLNDMFKKKVNQLSGGEKQRVAIARAIISKAEYIMADEPTGALDSENSKNIMEMLFELNKGGKTLIYVTHEPNLAQMAGRIITIKDGKVLSDIKNIYN